MKVNIEKVLCLLYLLVFSFLIVKGQEIIEHKGDTLIAISPTDLRTINCIIIDFENTKDQLDLYKRIVKEDSLLINNKDSILVVQSQIMTKKENYYINTAMSLQNDLKKEKKKRKIWTGILSGVAAVLGILAINK